MSTADSTSRPKPIPGSSEVRLTAPARNSAAQMTAITASTVLAGSTAFTSVYEAPVCTTPRWEKLAPDRATPVGAGLGRKKAPGHQERGGGGASGGVAPPGRREPAVEHVDRHGQDEREEDGGEQEGEQHPDERVDEHEE